MFLFVVFGLIFGGILRQSARLSTLRATSSSFEGIATASPFGQRIDARSLTKETFQKYFDGKYPVILTNIFDVENEEWTKELLGALGDKEIEYDVRCSSDGSIESYEATLNDFVSSLSDNSDHDENMYLMNEDLLRNETRLLDFLKGSIPLFGEDLFDHFPKKIRPYQALIIGGVGARSFLHCDPYEWMGINYLFEGRKLWTFLSPDVPASLFEARRNAPDAWGAYNISAGWVSDVDLYRHRQNILLGALAGAHMKQRPENKGMKGTRTGLEILTSSTLNNKWLQTAISDNWSEAANKNSAQSLSNSNLDVPIFLSGLDAVDYCQDPRLAAGALQLVQEEGDLILIPPRFWHQVYHLEPSIALASQYVNELGKDTTFRHILKWCSTGDSEENVGSSATATSLEEISSLPVQDQVMSIIKKGLKLQHGIVKGPALMRKLLSKTENDD